jgi:hypothetical protein
MPLGYGLLRRRYGLGLWWVLMWNVINEFSPSFISFPLLIIIPLLYVYQCHLVRCITQSTFSHPPGFILESSSLPNHLTDHTVGAFRFPNKSSHILLFLSSYVFFLIVKITRFIYGYWWSIVSCFKAFPRIAYLHMNKVIHSSELRKAWSLIFRPPAAFHSVWCWHILEN